MSDIYVILENYVFNEESIYDKSSFDEILRCHSNNNDIVAYRGLNFNTKDELDNFMEKMSNNDNSYFHTKASGFSPDYETAKGFAYNQSTYFPSQKVILAEQERALTEDIMSGYCGVVLKAFFKKGEVADLSSAGIQAESEVLLPPRTNVKCEIEIVDSYKTIIGNGFDFKEHILNTTDSSDEMFNYILKNKSKDLDVSIINKILNNTLNDMSSNNVKKAISLLNSNIKCDDLNIILTEKVLNKIILNKDIDGDKKNLFNSLLKINNKINNHMINSKSILLSVNKHVSDSLSNKENHYNNPLGGALFKDLILLFRNKLDQTIIDKLVDKVTNDKKVFSFRRLEDCRSLYYFNMDFNFDDIKFLDKCNILTVKNKSDIRKLADKIIDDAIDIYTNMTEWEKDFIACQDAYNMHNKSKTFYQTDMYLDFCKKHEDKLKIKLIDNFDEPSYSLNWCLPVNHKSLKDVMKFSSPYKRDLCNKAFFADIFANSLDTLDPKVINKRIAKEGADFLYDMINSNFKKNLQNGLNKI